jgi:hypothetical protein
MAIEFKDDIQVPDITINGSALGTNAFTSTTIPTNNNQLTNGAGYVTTSGNTTIGINQSNTLNTATVFATLNFTNGVATSATTRTLTLSNLGFTGASNANYITNNNQLTNGAGYVTTSGNTTIGLTQFFGVLGPGESISEVNLVQGCVTSIRKQQLNNKFILNGNNYITQAPSETAYGSFSPPSAQVISSGGVTGTKVTLNLSTSQITAQSITASSSSIAFDTSGLYHIDFNFASTVSASPNRTLAAANLEYSTNGTTWTAIQGSQVYNYDRGTATSSGASTWGFVYRGSGSCSLIFSIATEAYIRARFWIEGRASSGSGITTVTDGCRFSAHKIA